MGLKVDIDVLHLALLPVLVIVRPGWRQASIANSPAPTNLDNVVSMIYNLS